MLKGTKKNITEKNFQENIIFIPRENYDIIEYMTTNGFYYDFNIENFNVDLIPIDIDLFSLERENSLKDIYIDNNLSCVSDLANAVVKLETCFGKIRNKYIKGDIAQSFCDIMKEKERENNLDSRVTGDEILGMIVFDRSVDFITLMTTNYTCEGLIDDSFGINLGKIEVKKSLLTENLNQQPKDNNNKVVDKDKDKIVRYGLTSDLNPFYCSFRCMHYLDFINYLKNIREYYQKLFTKKNSNKILTTNDLKHESEELHYFMNSLKNDLIMSENLINYVTDPLLDKEHKEYIQKEQLLLSGVMPENLHRFYDDILCEQKNLISLIKLTVIESLTQNGVSDYQKLKREILNIYGYQKIFLFRDLENLGWLKEKQVLKNLKNLTNLTYNQLYEKLQLLNENYDQKKVEDCSYVLSGYCPISLKIIESAIYGRWNTISDILRKIPGATYCPENEELMSNPRKDRNIIFIIFVGGVTYTEIEAIRFLNRKFNEENLKGKRKKTQFIILTTCVLNAKKILDNLGKEVSSPFTMRIFYDQTKKK